MKPIFPHKIQHDTLEIARFSIPYRIYGEGHHALVCVNGAQQSMGVWKSLSEFLGDEFRVVSFDLPGQGRSSINAGPVKVELEEQILCLKKVIERIQLKKYFMLGSSWGGLVAAKFASLYPEGLERLILASFGTKPTHQIIHLIKRGMGLYASERYMEIGHLLIEGFGQKIPEALKRATIKQFENISPEHLDAFHEHCRFVLSLEGSSVPIDFQSIKASTLIINGEEDNIIDYHDNLAIARLIPQCRTMLIENTGHFLHFERPEIMQHYRDFLVT